MKKRLLAIALSMLSVAPALATTPRRVVARRSAALTARVISTRSIYREDFEAQTREPAITSGSGITRAGWWLFAAQDDSTLVAAKGTDGSLDTIRVFPSVDGADRFSESAGNKKLKPDLEAALTIPIGERLAARFGAAPPRRRSTLEAVLLVGSGSKAILRDRIALIFPAEPLSASRVVAVRADAFYAALRREPALVGAGELNVEGVALVRGGRFLRVFNRGNGKKGSVAGSVDLPLDAFLSYLARAAGDPAAPFGVQLTRGRVYDLGRAADGEIVGITDAITLPPLGRAPRGLSGEILVFAAIVEHTATAVNDGHTSGSSIAVELPDGRVFVASLAGPAGVDGLKIEGLTIVSAKWVGRPAQLQVNLLGVTDSDAKDPDIPSTLARIEVTFTP